MPRSTERAALVQVQALTRSSPSLSPNSRSGGIAPAPRHCESRLRFSLGGTPVNQGFTCP
jgi:hypothetical protein